MRQLTPEALHVLHRQHHLISAEQLRQAGVGRRHRERLIAEGVLEPVGQSVFGVPGNAWTLEQRCIALSLQHPRAYITGPTAGRLTGLRRMPTLSDICLGVPHGSKTGVPPGVRLRQTTCLPEHHVRQLDNGMVVANWQRLAFDLAADLRRVDLMSVIDQMIHDGRTDMTELAATARLLCARGRAGSVQFSKVLLHRGGRSSLESHPEVRVFEGLISRGVPVVPQVRNLALPDGRQVRIDMAVETVRWAVEVDVHPAHLELWGTTSDKRRDRQLHLIDWQVERVTPLDLLDIRRLLDELAALYHARVAALGER